MDPNCSTICNSDGTCVDPEIMSASPCPNEGHLLLPSGDCTLFGCPEGYYRQNKTCIQCDISCRSCSGPGPSECFSCPADYYLNQGACIEKSSSAQSAFDVFVIHSVDPNTHASQQDGSAALPFLDLRDGLIRAQELAAPWTSANVTIFMSKGPHYIPL